MRNQPFCIFNEESFYFFWAAQKRWKSSALNCMTYQILSLFAFSSLFSFPTLSVWYSSLSVIIHNIHGREKVWCRFWRLLDIFLSLYRLPPVTSVQTTVCCMFIHADDMYALMKPLMLQPHTNLSVKVNGYALHKSDFVHYEHYITLLCYNCAVCFNTSFMYKCISEVKSDLLGQNPG